MKHMKKLIAVMLTFVMAFAMAATVFAADINISGGATGSEYEAYKLLNATDGGDGKYSYTLNDKYADAIEKVTKKTGATQIVEYISGLKDNADAIRRFADDVYAKIKTQKLESDYTTNNKNNKFENVEQGYYLIAETKTGNSQDTYSLVMLNTAGKTDINVTTKEGVPTLEKKIKEKNDSTGAETGWQDGADYDLEDEIPFKLTGTVSAKYASYKTYYYAFHDTMSSGLTFLPDSVEVKVDNNGTETSVAKSAYKVEKENLTDGCSFEVIFNDLKKIENVTVTATSKIVVEYKAKLNENAVIGSDGNPNEASLEYNNNPYYEGEGKPDETGKTPKDKVIAFTYKLVANKVDKDNKTLSGAGFTLYKFDNTANDYVKVGNEIKGTTENPITTFTFERLDAGKYKLVETTVPDGYNKAEDLEFTVEGTYETDSTNPKFKDLVIKDKEGNTTISGENKVFTVNLAEGSFNTNVVNVSGTALPTTGGMGTTIFYIIGAILIIGSGVLMITRRRMGKN